MNYIQMFKKTSQMSIASLCLLLAPIFACADIQNIHVTDVTTRAFSVVWASDEIISDARILIFSDAEGLTEINDINVALVSQSVANAHQQGIGKLDMTSLEPNATYYFQLESISSGASSFFPVATPYQQITTASRTTVDHTGGQAIINNVLTHALVHPDGISITEGTLLVVDVPGVALSPVTAFIGDLGVQSPLGMIDLNNIYGLDGQRIQIPENQMITVTEYRGFDMCPGLNDHQITRYRFASTNEGIPSYTQVGEAILCETFDLNCDGVISNADVQFVSDTLGANQGSCLFNEDFDFVFDNTIDIADEQAVLNAVTE